MYQPGFAAAFPGYEQLSETAAGCTAPWEFHPSEVLSEPPPLIESVAGREYHCVLTGSLRNSLPGLFWDGWEPLGTLFGRL